MNRLYGEAVLPRITTREADVAAAECEVILTRLQSLVESPDVFELTAAIFRFHMNDIAGARVHLSRALPAMDANDASPHLSLAFLSLWECNYRDALREYLHAASLQ